MALVRRGEIWHSVIVVNGKQKWESTGTSDRNKAKIFEAERLKRKKRYESEDTFSVKWDVFRKEYEDYCRVEKRESTNKSDSYTLDLYAKLCDIRYSHEITPDSLNKFKSLRSGEVSNSTINRNLGVLLNMARIGQKRLRAIPEHYDFKTVTKLDQVNKRRVFLELNETEKLKKALAQEPLKRRLIVLGGIMTGLRTGELMHLKVKYFDFTEKLIHLDSIPGWQPKNDEERSVPLYPEFEKVVKEWIEYRQLGPDDFVFSHEKGKRPHHGGQFSKGFFNDEFKTVLKAAGINKKATFYSSRHTFGTHMAGVVDLKTLQAIMGHSDITTTQIYLHLKKNAIREAVKTPPF